MRRAAPLRELGRTGIRLSSVGLGCWQFSEAQGASGMYWPALGQEAANAIVAASLQAGVTWFDTAEFYGGGASERALSAALQAAGVRQGEVAVATKWWPMFRGARSLKTTLGARLANLAPYGIDLHQIHNPFALSTLGGQMAALAELVATRQIGAAGVSNFSAARMVRAHAALAARGLVLASNQMRYSLLDRRIESNGVLDAARGLGITVIAYSPLAQGMLTGRFHREPERVGRVTRSRRMQRTFRSLDETRRLIAALEEIAAAHGATPAQVALAWLIQFQGDQVVAIPGASSVVQAESNAAAMDLRLAPRELARLDELSRRYR